MRSIIGLIFILCLTSCSSIRVQMAQSSCEPKFTTRFEVTVPRSTAIIRVANADVEGKTSKSVIYEYQEPTDNTVNELRCLVVSESKLHSKDEVVMVTAVFHKANVVQHFFMDREEKIFIAIKFSPIPGNETLMLGSAEIVYPLEGVLDRLSDPKSKYQLQLLGMLNQPFQVDQVKKLISKLADGKLFKEKQ